MKAESGKAARRRKRFQVGCFQSLRTRSSLCIALLWIVVSGALMGGIMGLLPDVFEAFEVDTAIAEVQRVASAISADMLSHATVMSGYSKWDMSVEAVESLLLDNDTYFEYYREQAYLDAGGWSEQVGQNLVAYYDTSLNLLHGEYHAVSADSICETPESPFPAELAGTTEASRAVLARMAPLYEGIYTPPGYPTFVLGFQAIQSPTDPGASTAGYLLWGFVLDTHVALYAQRAPVCLAMWETGNRSELPGYIVEALDSGELSPSIIDSSMQSTAWNGTVNVMRVKTRDIVAEPREKCPDSENATDDGQIPRWTSFGVVLLTDGFADHMPGPILRTSNERDIYHSGVSVLGASLSVSIAAIAAICIVFGVFLEYAVMRRLDRLRKFLASVSASSSTAGSSDDSGSITVPSESFGGSRRSGSRPQSMTASSVGESTGDEGGDDGDLGFLDGDEIGNLGRMAGRRVDALRRRLDKTTALLEKQRHVSEQHRDALRLLNLLCGRDASDATELSQQQQQAQSSASASSQQQQQLGLSELLSSPICVEFLKAFCESESSLQNVLFLLDLAYLRDLERTHPKRQDQTPDPVVAEAAHMIRSMYLSKKAAAPIQVSRSVRHHIHRSSGYAPRMFDAAEAEVTKMLTNETLPRFRKSRGFENMLLALRVESGGATDEGSADPDEEKSRQQLRAPKPVARLMGVFKMAVERLRQAAIEEEKEDEERLRVLQERAAQRRPSFTSTDGASKHRGNRASLSLSDEEAEEADEEDEDVGGGGNGFGSSDEDDDEIEQHPVSEAVAAAAAAAAAASATPTPDEQQNRQK